MTPRPYFPSTRDKPYSTTRQIIDGILNLLYPDVCLVCSAPVIRSQDRGVCADCWEKTLRLAIHSPMCTSCGLPLHTPDQSPAVLCGECILAPPPYSGARSFGYYTSELRSLVQALKFDGKRNLAGLFGPLLAGTFFEAWSRDEFDLIVPVPLHTKRARQRGFNQAAILAKALSAQIAVPICRNALARVRHTLPQVGLSNAQRRENLRNAFVCVGTWQVARQRILLADDVMTTGATVASAARALLEGGALRVSVITVARAVPGL